MNRWKRLWRAVVQWWKNEYDAPDRAYLDGARKCLVEYDDLYGERVKIPNPLYRSQAAAIVEAEGHKRAPTLESEVRVLAITVERLTAYLEVLHQLLEEREGNVIDGPAVFPSPNDLEKEEEPHA